MNFATRVSNVARTLSALAFRPDVVRLAAFGVPPRLALALDQPWLRALDVRTVLDVGANTGQFALAAQMVFPNAKVHSFEPLPGCFRVLQQRAARFPAVRVLNLALGEGAGNVAFNENDYSPSSSVLPLDQWHRSAFPEARAVRTVDVKMERLDTVAESLGIADPLLLKIDVQGYEDRVLRGGEGTARRASVILVETSFVPLYVGQPSHQTVCEILQSWGFSYVGALDQLCDPHTGRVLSADSIFVRGS